MRRQIHIELDPHEASQIARAGDLSASERLHLLNRLRKKLPDQLQTGSVDSPDVRDRKLDLDTALDELWRSVAPFDNETWDEVVTPDEAYTGHRISNFGRVVSLPVERTIELHGRRIRRIYPGRLLSPAATSNGRERVCLRKDGRQKLHYIDQLVWWTFKDTNQDDLEHINGDPRDCRLDNLRPAS